MTTTPPVKPAAKTAPAKKARLGRPPTGQTSDAERKRKSRENLNRAGGRRIDLHLLPAGAADLAEVHKDNPGLDDTAAIHLALHWYATRRSRKPK